MFLRANWGEAPSWHWWHPAAKSFTAHLCTAFRLPQGFHLLLLFWVLRECIGDEGLAGTGRVQQREAQAPASQPAAGESRGVLGQRRCWTGL